MTIEFSNKGFALSCDTDGITVKVIDYHAKKIKLTWEELGNLKEEACNRLDGIDMTGFSEAVSIRELSLEEIPIEKGVYLVIRKDRKKPRFLVEGTGGRFQNQDLNYPLEILEENWIPDAKILYIGKAGGQEGLRQRIKQLEAFGRGRHVGHRGGRAIWQLENSEDLLISWRTFTADQPRQVEKDLIQKFVSKHGSRPFANMQN